jgi:GNAT superfamily N-acetyltransferase
MQELGWVLFTFTSSHLSLSLSFFLSTNNQSQDRAKVDCATHFRVAQNGKNWLLVTPSSTGKPEGCVLALTYPNSTGWISFFILKKAFRGQGLGRELWKEMELTFQRNGTTTIGLDGVQEQHETYKRRGFESVGKVLLMTRNSLDENPVKCLELSGDVEMQNLKDVDPAELARLDYEHTGFDREAYWSTDSILSRPDSLGFAIRSHTTSRLTGFIFIRSSQEGHRFGPLYAETYAEAKQLLHKAMNAVPASKSYVTEIFGNNAEGQKCFEELGWQYDGQSWFHRMWLGGRVPKEQQKDGKGARGMYAIFDAATG